MIQPVSRFRRCCMEMMAWSLSNDERAKAALFHALWLAATKIFELVTQFAQQTLLPFSFVQVRQHFIALDKSKPSAWLSSFPAPVTCAMIVRLTPLVVEILW